MQDVIIDLNLNQSHSTFVLFGRLYKRFFLLESLLQIWFINVWLYLPDKVFLGNILKGGVEHFLQRVPIFINYTLCLADGLSRNIPLLTAVILLDFVYLLCPIGKWFSEVVFVI